MFKVPKVYSLGVYGPRTTPWEFTAVNPMVYGSKLLDTPYFVFEVLGSFLTISK